jgi:hypothetical protein
MRSRDERERENEGRYKEEPGEERKEERASESEEGTPFSSPGREREITQMIVTIGRQRFAIHWEIEDLPPTRSALIPLKTTSRKSQSPASICWILR